MENLTIAHVNQFLENDFKPLFQKLLPDMKPLWGQMTPQHMVEHLVWSVQMSNGRVVLPIKNPEEKLPRLQRYLYNLWGSPILFKSPVMDPENLPPLNTESLQAAKFSFWEEWEKFEKHFHENPESLTPNPVFGFLSEEQWRRFHFKHFVHHLSQFGLTNCVAHGLKPSKY